MILFCLFVFCFAFSFVSIDEDYEESNFKKKFETAQDVILSYM